MCIDGTCCCMQEETGCLILLAFISTILSGLVIVFFVGLIYYLNYILGFGGDPISYGFLQIYNMFFILAICSITFLWVFTLILLYGAVKKKEDYLEAYIACGTLQTVFVLSLYLFFSLLCSFRGYHGYGIYLLLSMVSIIPVGLCSGLILYAVRATSPKLDRSLPQPKSKPEETIV
ncbi:uncharacterized protein LOC119832925 [Zerene cesonia]|uniref:uncharacterized protein LOC119832925 n=1 Tax=Zerene cesonia TaxID=33412 RepID=UPI0018E55C25|nr:uncharacterized protein LOC119832925 [Zerene cesonia]